MTTENVAVPQDDSPDIPLSVEPEVVPAEEPADAATLQAQVKKLEGDLRAEKGRSTRGRQTRQDDMENLMLGTSNEVRMLNRRVDALMQAIGTGNTDALPDELSQIQNQALQSQGELDYQRFWQTESQALLDAINDGDGNPLFDLQNSPELEQVRQNWTAAHERRDRAGLTQARAEAQEVARQAERQGRAVDSGAFELDTGPSAAGGGMGDERWLKEVYGNSSYNPTNADHKRAKDILDRLSG